MSLTRKGSVWEIKNSIFIILTFIPVINCFPFFYMYNRIAKRKWLIFGWTSLILQILAIGIVIGWSFFAESPTIDYTTKPDIKDYLGYNYREKYGDEYTKLPEYEEYQKAVDEWYKTPEYIEQDKAREEFSQTSKRVGAVSIFSMLVIYIINLIIVLSERAKYLKLLETNQVNKETFTKKMQENIKQSNNKSTIITSSTNLDMKKTNVNFATEEELISNLGITIIEAKKVMDYRDKIGEFRTKDDFFSSFNAKPHIIARLEDFIIIELQNNNNKPNKDLKRRVDI